MYDFDWSSIPGALPFLWQGMQLTLKITFTAVVVGIVWGTVLAMLRLSGSRVIGGSEGAPVALPPAGGTAAAPSASFLASSGSSAGAGF